MNGNIEKMIKLVSTKLNIQEEKLKEWLEKNDVEGMLNNMRKEDAEKLKNIINNPSLKEKLMKSSEAENFMKKLKEQKV